MSDTRNPIDPDTGLPVEEQTPDGEVGEDTLLSPDLASDTLLVGGEELGGADTVLENDELDGADTVRDNAELDGDVER